MASPVQMTADQIVHDRDLGIVTAQGRVEIVQSGRSLTAETVSYNLKQDVITASGNVTLMEPTGDVVFSNYFELTGDFKDGIARQIRVLLSDRSRMQAESATRVGGDRTDFDNASYTACEPCASDPSKRPLWEAKAERVTHNQAEQTIEYRDAWIELGGIPVAYTPYLSHPDPTLKRKTGFLVPTAGLSSSLGANVTIPYYWTLGDNQDVTFAPRFLFPKSKLTEAPEVKNANREILQRTVMAGEHRWTGKYGETRTAGSFTADKNTAEYRGHLDAKGRFDLTETWRAGYAVQRTSDDTYSDIYGYRIEGDRPWLTSRPYVEGFGRSNYAMMEGFSFQGVRRQDDPGNSPLVLPHAIYSYIGTPDARGGYWTADSDMLAYSRSEGTDAGRLSQQVAWHRPFMSRLGDITTLHTSLRGDGYHAENLSAYDTSSSPTSGRAVPQVAVDWRFPFVNSSRTLPQVIEPMAMFAASPNGGNPSEIPNEDSIDFELDEINVMRPNRLTGLDRVESGVRGAYGLRWSAYPGRGGFISAQAAQGWRTRKQDSVFGPESGFSEQMSDYLGRVDVSPNSNLSFLNRVRLDRNTLEAKRNESTISFGPRMLRLSTSYLMFERSDIAPRRQYLAYSVTSELTRYWSMMASASHSLTDDGGPLGWQTRLVYSDDCFAFVTNMRRFYTNDRDLESGYEVTFNIVFKTLGDVPFNLF